MDFAKYNEWLWSGPDYPFIWFFTIITVFYLSYKMYNMHTNKDFLKSSKRLFQGYAVFFFCYALTRFFFLLSDYYSFYGDYENEEYRLFHRIAYFISGIGFAWLIRGFEAHFVKTHYSLSSAIFLLTLGIIFLPYSIYQTLTYIMGIVIVVFLAFVYIIAFLNSQGPVKKSLLNAVFYTILFYMCIVLDSRVARDIVKDTDLRWTTYILPAFLMIFSLVQMTNNIPYIDPTNWFYHLWVLENKEGNTIYETGFRKIEIDKENIASMINKLFLFSDNLNQGDLGELNIANYLFFLLKFDNFTLICATHENSKKSDIKFFLIEIGNRFNAEYPIILENNYDQMHDFRNFSRVITRMMKKKPIEIEAKKLNIKL